MTTDPTTTLDFSLLGDIEPKYVPTAAAKIAWLRSELARMDRDDAMQATYPPAMLGCENGAYGARSLDKVTRPRYEQELAELEQGVAS